jgi:prolyl-tRNA synthetase
MAKNICSMNEDFSRWYGDVIAAAGLADYSPVKGCMVIMPHGYALWENIQSELDRRFKETGHVNAYFPLFIPQSFLEKEAMHVEGFALECALVTHSGLERDTGPDGEVRLIPRGKLEEPLIVRPTSETIIGHSYAKWVQSWRDLPLLINQWANVVRWEMRTRLFLRTTEFLWQEGHTAHETEKEAQEETLKILDLYAEFAENEMALPMIKGMKTDAEKFPGAQTTYCIEGLMKNGWSLQAGTSHNLGQNFARSFEIKFQSREGREEYAWTTSWGVSTRLIGALIMGHSDDDGLILPPRLAPVKVVIVPIYKDEDRRTVLEAASRYHRELKKAFRPGEVVLDDRDQMRPPQKFFEWEQKGVPLRLEIGPREVEQRKIVVKRRTDREKLTVGEQFLSRQVLKLLEQFHQDLYKRGLDYRAANTHPATDYGKFKKEIAEKPGFYVMAWDGDPETEARVKEETKATIRAIPLNGDDTAALEGRIENLKDPVSGKPAKHKVIYARAF